MNPITYFYNTDQNGNPTTLNLPMLLLCLCCLCYCFFTIIALVMLNSCKSKHNIGYSSLQ
jgi:hypothetical protein